MTLILAYSSHWFSTCASDRLVTVRKKSYDTTSNKILICLLKRAVLAIGYTGLAFIDHAPSDQWLMKIIARTPYPIDYGNLLNIANNPEDINGIVQRIVAGFNAETLPGTTLCKNYIEIGISGIFLRANYMHPYLLIMKKTKNSSEIHFTKATRQINKNYKKSFIWLSGGWVNSRPDLFRNLYVELLRIDPESKSSPDDVGRLLIDQIRLCAQAIPGIGNEIMLASHKPLDKYSSVEFFGTNGHSVPGPVGALFGSHDARYSPWIFGEHSIYCPSLLIGDSEILFGDYRVCIKGGTSSVGGFLWEPQPRAIEPQ